MNIDDLKYFDIFPWTNDFKTGIKLIDEQHQELVRIINLLGAHVSHHSSDDILDEIFSELAHYAEFHFKTEENIWLEHFKEDPWFVSHQHTHNSFKDKIHLLRENKGGRPLDVVIQDVMAYLIHWLAYHILYSDKRMALAIFEIKSGNSVEEAKIKADDIINLSTTHLIDTILYMYDNLSSRTIELLREKSLRIQAEKALSTSEERWRFILESGAENVWDFDLEENKIYHENVNAELFEIVKKNGISIDKGSMIHPEDIEQIEADLKEHLDGKTEFYVNKHRIIHENGSWGWVLSRGKVVSRDENNNPLRIVGTNTDITERELAALIYKNSSQAVLICDKNKNIISVNPSFTKITGYEEQEVLGKNPNFLSSGRQDKEFYDQMWNQINTNGTYRGEIYNKRKDGTIYHESIEIDAVTDVNGHVDHYFALFNDITESSILKNEREQYRAHSFQQSRMAQMGEMISMIAHQWRQPLGAISATSIGLSVQLELDTFNLEVEEGRKKCQEYFINGLKEIDQLVQSLTNTIDDFRNFYKPDRESHISFIHDSLNRAMTIIKGSIVSNGIEVISKCTNQQKVKIHSNEIVQVILNIIKNAQDNFKEKEIKDPKIFITCTDSDNKVVLEICDNGGGIPEAILPRIFDPYFSTKDAKNGTGLGLYMSKTIIEEHHNGSLKVENRDNGVCFTIILDAEI